MPTTSRRDVADLWGAPFGEKRVVSEPFEDLQKQAESLTHRTNGRIVGHARETIRGETVWIGLWAKVPAMGGYEYKLITVAHPLNVVDPRRPYPLEATYYAGRITDIAEHESWMSWLADVLSSNGAMPLIDRLLQIGADRESD